MNVIEMATKAIAMMSEGREAISKIADAVRDGQVALGSKDMTELNALLAQEKTESEAAHNTLQRAIQIAQGG